MATLGRRAQGALDSTRQGADHKGCQQRLITLWQGQLPPPKGVSHLDGEGPVIPAAGQSSRPGGASHLDRRGPAALLSLGAGREWGSGVAARGALQVAAGQSGSGGGCRRRVEPVRCGPGGPDWPRAAAVTWANSDTHPQSRRSLTENQTSPCHSLSSRVPGLSGNAR